MNMLKYVRNLKGRGEVPGGFARGFKEDFIEDFIEGFTGGVI